LPEEGERGKKGKKGGDSLLPVTVRPQGKSQEKRIMVGSLSNSTSRKKRGEKDGLFSSALARPKKRRGHKAARSHAQGEKKISREVKKVKAFPSFSFTKGSREGRKRRLNITRRKSQGLLYVDQKRKGLNIRERGVP